MSRTGGQPGEIVERAVASGGACLDRTAGPRTAWRTPDRVCGDDVMTNGDRQREQGLEGSWAARRQWQRRIGAGDGLRRQVA